MRSHTFREAIELAPPFCKTCPVVIAICFTMIVYGCSATWSISLPDGRHTDGDVKVKQHQQDEDPIADNP